MLAHHLLVTLVDDARPARAAARAARVDVGRLFLGLAIRGAAHEEMWGRGWRRRRGVRPAGAVVRAGGDARSRVGGPPPRRSSPRQSSHERASCTQRPQSKTKSSTLPFLFLPRRRTLRPPLVRPHKRPPPHTHLGPPRFRFNLHIHPRRRHVRDRVPAREQPRADVDGLAEAAAGGTAGQGAAVPVL